MNVVINIFAILTAIFGVPLIWGGITNRHYGSVIAGVGFLLGAYLAFTSVNLIPIAVAFILAWILRKLGLDPST